VAKPPLEDLPVLQGVLREFGNTLNGSGRTLVRYSGTEDKIRLMVEAIDTHAVETWMNRLAHALQDEGLLAENPA
jgi:phosphoglucosamine mutase